MLDLEEHLKAKEPVSITLTPNGNLGELPSLKVNWGEYGFVENNRAHTLAHMLLNGLLEVFEVGDGEASLVSENEGEVYAG